MQKEEFFAGTLFLDEPPARSQRRERSASLSPPSGGRHRQRGRPEQQRRSPFSRPASPREPFSHEQDFEEQSSGSTPPSPQTPPPLASPSFDEREREDSEGRAHAEEQEGEGAAGRGMGRREAGPGQGLGGGDEEEPLDQPLFVPFGIYSGTPGVPHPHHAVTEELKSLENPEDASWCFMCNLRPADAELLEWQELINHIETLGSRELTSILKDVQRSYNLHFRESCEGRVWTLKSIEEHIFHHGGASEQAHAREQKRQFAMLRHFVAEHSCLHYDLSSNRVVPNTEGIAQVIKLAKLEQNLQNAQR